MRIPGVIAAICAAGRACGLAILLAGLLAACTLRGPEALAPQIAAVPDPAETLVPEMRLIEAAERAERALASLARTLPTPDPASAMPALDTVPAALGRPVTLDWAGPLEGLVRELARRAGYRFLVAGLPPARPLMVSLEMVGEPLIAVLRDAGLRAGDAATLTVDAAAETVVLDWTGPSATPEEEG